MKGVLKLGLTSLETFDPLIHTLLRLLPLFLFLHLNLFPVFLVLSFLSFLLAPLDFSGLVQQTLTDTFHVRIGLDHFGKVVRRACEWELEFQRKGTGFLDAMKGLFVAVALGE